MKRFEFPLERLLKIKRQLKKQAELEKLLALEELDAAELALQSLRDQLARASAQLAAAVGSALVVTHWASAAGKADWLGQQIKAAEQVVAVTRQKYEVAAENLRMLAREVEALTKLREQQLEQWRYEAAKATQEQLDELGLRRWQAARDAAVARAAAAPEPADETERHS